MFEKFLIWANILFSCLSFRCYLQNANNDRLSQTSSYRLKMYCFQFHSNVFRISVWGSRANELFIVLNLNQNIHFRLARKKTDGRGR